MATMIPENKTMNTGKSYPRKARKTQNKRHDLKSELFNQYALLACHLFFVLFVPFVDQLVFLK
jgi:hypothetical protein